MRRLFLLLALAGCPADPIESAADAMPDAPQGLACRWCGPGAECAPLEAACRATYGPDVHAFVCDPGAPLGGPGYTDCYRAGDLWCCTDPVE